MPPDPSRIPERFPPERRDWLPISAFVFVVLALIALAVAPSLLLSRIAATTRAVTTTALPAYDLLRDFAFAMEQRVSVARSLYLTGDSRYVGALAEAKAAEETALRSLETLAPRFGPRSVEYIADIRRYRARRETVEARVEASGRDIAVYRAATPQFDLLRDSILVAVAGMRTELAAHTESLVANEARLARLERSLSIVLGIAALMAALLVGWFALEQRRLRREVQVALDESNRLRILAERQTDDLRRTAMSRARLMQGITHDVKNPLGAARGYVDLLEMGVNGPLPEQHAPFVAGIRRSIDGALAIITDLLDLARADSGGLTVKAIDIDLRDVVKAVVEDHRAEATAAGHELTLSLPASALPVHTDPARVEQVLANLLSNAVKYTPAPGRITVTCTRHPPPATAHERATVEVSDTGPGIPRDMRDAIFDEFTRLDEAGPRKGHGLGLPIARRLTKLIGGDLTLADGEGPGATFVLSLPLSEPGR